MHMYAIILTFNYKSRCVKYYFENESNFRNCFILYAEKYIYVIKSRRHCVAKKWTNVSGEFRTQIRFYE